MSARVPFKGISNETVDLEFDIHTTVAQIKKFIAVTANEVSPMRCRPTFTNCLFLPFSFFCWASATRLPGFVRQSGGHARFCESHF